MTETPQQHAEQTRDHFSQPGVDRQNLRNYERLYRSIDDRKIAGVAGGLGRHLNIDPTILRVLFVVLCFFGGAGFLLYGAAWLIVPEDGRSQGTIAASPSTRNALLITAGVIGALLLVGDSWHGIGFPWPVMLAAIGVLFYVLSKRRGEQAETVSEPVPPWAPAPDQVGPAGAAPAAYAPATYTPRPRPDRGPKLFGFTLAMVAVALGAMGLYEAAGGHVVDAAYPALALTIVGAMLVVGAFVGRAGGLIFLGIISTFALLATSVAGTFGALNKDNGERVSEAPTSATAVKSDYRIDSGRIAVDLSRVGDPEQLDGRVIRLDAGAGELVVTMPRGVRSKVVADIGGPGLIELPGRSTGGFGNHLQHTYGDGTALVTIDAHLSAGHIDVRNP